MVEFGNTIISIKEGFREGWCNGDGFVAYSHSKTQLQELVRVLDLRKLFRGRVVVSPIIQCVSDMYRDAQPLGALVADRAIAFASLQIDPTQWENLQAIQAPLLTQDEISRLESMSDQPVALGVYKDLLSRLEENVCPLLIEGPEKKEAVLLTKQYQNQGGPWLPVPNSSKVYDKESLQQALAIHGQMTHPTSRDLISTPSAYELYPHAPTRYVWHKYYVNEGAVSGISQELSGQAQELRGRLDSAPRPTAQLTPSKVELIRCARLAFFERNQSHDVILVDGARKTTLSCTWEHQDN